MVAINADGNMPIDLVDENEDIEMYLDKMMTEKGKILDVMAFWNVLYASLYKCPFKYQW